MRMLIGLASVFMAGCSRLNEEPGVQAVLSLFDRLNHKVGLMTDSNHRLARTYPQERRSARTNAAQRLGRLAELPAYPDAA